MAEPLMGMWAQRPVGVDPGAMVCDGGLACRGGAACLRVAWPVRIAEVAIRD